MNLLKLSCVILLLCGAAGFAQVRFDANFESGNMESVSTTDSVTFTVRTKTDIGGRWFYFRMRGVKNRFIRVKVSGSDVKRAMFSYDDANYLRFAPSESPATNTFEKTYTEDSVWVAYYTPYTFSYLKKRISQWLQYSSCSLDTIGFTKKNLPLYKITVTDRSIPDSLKEHIWIHARTHPGETPSSWQFDGIMKTLLGNDEAVRYYLRKLVFHCIPFTNPDGVFYGRSRTNFDTIDVESNWNKPDSTTCKEVLLLKQHMLGINQKKVLKIFLNLHSQAAPYCTFWIHTAASTSNFFYRREMQFANLNISDNPYFRFSDFSYSALSPTFPEGWQWKNWGEATMALTYETPYDYYSSNALVDSVNLAYLGERTVFALAEYLELSHPKRMLIDMPFAASNWLPDTAGTDFFGEDYYTSTGGNGGSPAVFGSSILPPGKYEVFGWWPASSLNAPNAKFSIEGGGSRIEKIVDQRANGGKWNLLGALSLFSNGEINIAVRDSGSGRVVADAFRILYRGATVRTENEVLPAAFRLYQNYPNPFNARTIIKYSLERESTIRLQVFNALGQIVATIADGVQSAGMYETSFDAAGLPSGAYYARLSVNNNAATKAMILLK